MVVKESPVQSKENKDTEPKNQNLYLIKLLVIEKYPIHAYTRIGYIGAPVPGSRFLYPALQQGGGPDGKCPSDHDDAPSPLHVRKR